MAGKLDRMATPCTPWRAAAAKAASMPSGNVTGISFAGKGDWLATGSDQGFIQLWNLRIDDLIRMANAKFLP